MPSARRPPLTVAASSLTSTSTSRRSWLLRVPLACCSSVAGVASACRASPREKSELSAASRFSSAAQRSWSASRCSSTPRNRRLSSTTSATSSTRLRCSVSSASRSSLSVAHLAVSVLNCKRAPFAVNKRRRRSPFRLRSSSRHSREKVAFVEARAAQTRARSLFAEASRSRALQKTTITLKRGDRERRPTN